MARLSWLALCFLMVQSIRAQDASPVLIYLTVPADAMLAIDGVPVKQTGPERRLITPSFQPGQKGEYTVTLTMQRDGKTVTIDRVINVEGGKITRVDLTAVAAKKEPKKEAVTPKKEELKKIEPKKEEPKKVEPKKVEPKKVEPKKEEPKVAPKKEDPPVKPKVEVKKKLDAPYFPTPPKVVEEMLKLAGVKETDVVYDLGCGDARIVVAAADKFKAKKAVGIDLDPQRVTDSKANVEKAGLSKKVEIREGDMFKVADLADATVVTLYLLPEVNERLKPLLRNKLKPGARVVSHDFDMGDDWTPDKQISVKDEKGNDHTLYLWTIKENKAEPKQDEKKKEEKVKLDAPFVPTPHSVVDEMLKFAGVKEGDVVYDLGCGDGRIVIAAVKGFKAEKAIGIDLDPERIKECNAAAKEAKIDHKVEFREQDVLKIDSVADANVVCLYLFPEVNEKLKPMLLKTLKPGSRIVSHDFLMGDDFKPEKTIEVKDANGDVHSLYLWTIAEAKK